MSTHPKTLFAASASACFAVLLWALSAASPTSAAAAAEKKYPFIEGAISIEIENDWNFDSDSADSEHNQLFTLTEPEATLRFTPEFSLFAHAVLTPVTDPDAGEDRAFEDNGLWIEDLYLSFETDRFSVKGGKFTPNFGLGWDETPGVFGSGFAGAGYEFAERVGVAGGVSFGNGKVGTHTIEASTFFLDTSFLTHTTLKGRGTTGHADGGVSNTEDFSSFAVSVNGEDVGGFKGLRYHTAYIHQANGVDGTDDETGFAIALTHTIDLGKDVTLTPLVEFVHFNDLAGAKDAERDFITVSGLFNWKSWNFAIALVERNDEAADGTETNDFQFQLSVGYEFDFGLAVDVGWAVANESNIETQTLGVLLAYTLEF